MSDDETYSSFLGFTPTAAPEDSLEAIADVGVRNTAAVFAKNFADVSNMFGFPIILTYASLSGQREMMNFMEACKRGKLSAARYGRDAEVTKKINEEMAKIRTTEGLDWIGAEARKLLLSVLRHPDVVPGIRIFLSSLLSASWTAFETMANDLWTVCLNSRPGQLGNQVIFNLPQKTRGGAEKYISLRFLSKHNFA